MKKIFISIGIILFVSFLAVNSLSLLLKDVSFETYENDCERVIHRAGERNIVLRVDDVQSYYIQDTQMQLIEDALKRNKTVSLSVIPINLDKDKDMIKFLLENRCKIEIGMHGYNNVDFEFAELNYKRAKEKINKGLEILNQVEPEIVTFIPPNNEFSEDAERAIYNSGFKVISAEHYNSDYGYTQSHFDYNTEEFVDYRIVLAECNKTLNNNESCVIMFHPQNYYTNGEFDSKKYKNYLDLLDKLDTLDAEVVTFRDLYHKDSHINVIRIN